MKTVFFKRLQYGIALCLLGSVAYLKAAPITLSPFPQNAYLLTQEPALPPCLLDGETAATVCIKGLNYQIILWHLDSSPISSETISFLTIPSLVAIHNNNILIIKELVSYFVETKSYFANNASNDHWDEHQLPAPSSGIYTANANSVNLVVGSIQTTNPNSIAAFWQKDLFGNYSGPFTMNPNGYLSSVALGVDGNKVVGYARRISELNHAFVWQLSSDYKTFEHLDLSQSIPSALAISSSYAQAIDGNRVVGYGVNTFGSYPLVWNIPTDIRASTAASAITCAQLPLPQGLSNGKALQIAGDYIVGYGYTGSDASDTHSSHALVWHWDALTNQWDVDDLNQNLPASPTLSDSFIASTAQGVNANGEVTGLAYTSTGKGYPVVWTNQTLNFSNGSSLPQVPSFHFPFSPHPPTPSPYSWPAIVKWLSAFKYKIGRIALGLFEMWMSLAFFGYGLELLEKAKRLPPP